MTSDYTNLCEGGTYLKSNVSIFLKTYDFKRNLIWTRNIGGKEHIISATFRSNFKSKIDKDGNVLWIYADNDFDAGYAYSIIKDKNDKVYTIDDYVNSGFFIPKR